MFKSKQNRELEKKIESLEEERRKLREEIEDLKLEKKTTEEDIKHMVRLKEEKDVVANEKMRVKMEGDKQLAIAVVKDTYRDKMEQNLQNQLDKMDSMYKELLARLPNVTAKFERKETNG